jgi:DNA-binding response OmpR family regulator
VDLDMHTARVDGEVLDLTRREFELLAYFLQNPRRVLSREKILQQVWGLEYLGESRTIDAHVRRVRAKLGDAATYIETVVGVGYRLGSVDG